MYSIWDPKSPVPAQGWWVLPTPDRIPEVWDAWRKLVRGRARGSAEEKRAYNVLMELEGELWTTGFSDKYTKDEIEEFKKLCPYLWWKSLDHCKCPGCGQVGLTVRNTFRAPKQKDTKRWKEVTLQLEKGETFSYCLTRDEEVALFHDAQLERKRQEGRASWSVEKGKRIEASRLEWDAGDM
ncbi:hypothetical protein NLJ89_g2670 [Agrocybe chaxingu]|uniref:Uncharacterized protein n=1 Tax=Agrocybe chaxingu TaxID=84603 RepID=A0A9W8K723_9AGAR|nr:hypothetical protein NLJ89_g2670 [Agrocybe chaxingu]